MRALKAHKAHVTGTGKVAGADKTANADKTVKDAGKGPKFRREYLVRPSPLISWVLLAVCDGVDFILIMFSHDRDKMNVLRCVLFCASTSNEHP
jgi:hypothetical protein